MNALQVLIWFVLLFALLGTGFYAFAHPTNWIAWVVFIVVAFVSSAYQDS